MLLKEEIEKKLAGWKASQAKQTLDEYFKQAVDVEVGLYTLVAAILAIDEMYKANQELAMRQFPVLPELANGFKDLVKETLERE